MSTPAGPARDSCLTAIAKCLAVRRADHLDSPQRGALTDAAIAERVHGVLVPPRQGPDAWWLVGRILDEIADQELNVWLIPAQRRIGLSLRGRHAPLGPPQLLTVADETSPTPS